jgi:hypothetical protein
MRPRSAPTFIRFLNRHGLLLCAVVGLSLMQGTILLLSDLGLQIFATDFEPDTWAIPGKLPVIPSSTVWHYIHQHQWAAAELWGGHVLRLFGIQLFPVSVYMGLSHDRTWRLRLAFMLWSWPLLIVCGPLFGAFQRYRHRSARPDAKPLPDRVLILAALGFALLTVLPMAAASVCLLVSIPFAIASGISVLTGDFALDGPTLNHGLYFLAVVGSFELFWLGVCAGDAFWQWRQSVGALR